MFVLFQWTDVSTEGLYRLVALVKFKLDEPVTYDDFLNFTTAAWLQISEPDRARLLFLAQQWLVSTQRNKLDKLKSRLQGMELGSELSPFDDQDLALNPPSTHTSTAISDRLPEIFKPQRNFGVSDLAKCSLVASASRSGSQSSIHPTTR